MELTPERIELLLTITQEPSRRFLSRAYSSGCVKIERRAISSSGPDGEIGRHSGLKIRRPLSGRGGSSPPPGTMESIICFTLPLFFLILIIVLVHVVVHVR